MGSADKRGVVAPRDEDDTIDGVRDDTSRPPPPMVAKPPLTDYPSLAAVEKTHYDFGDTIAQGGMGRVIKARDRRLGRRVAVKELLPSGRAAARRFEREARITARLQHPSIVHVYEAGVWTGGEPFYAMNHVDGEPMSDVIEQRPELDDRLALLPNVIAVAEALAYAHNENVIHRDLKPSNILIGAFGETVVIDWGLAKDLGAPHDPMESLAMRRLDRGPEETNDGSILGTPAYMPPEQARGESVDRRADVYALGALLYHVIARHAPYGSLDRSPGESPGARAERTLKEVQAGPCPPVEQLQPATPVDLVTIVRKAMARDPEERYRDAAEVADELRAFQAGQLIAARNYTRRELVKRWLAKHRVVVGIAGAAVVVLLIVGAISIQRILHEKRKEELALSVNKAQRKSLLEERGRSELLAGQAGRAAVNLAEAARDGSRGGARGLLLADALRSFEAQLERLPSTGTPGTATFATSGRVFTIADHIYVFDGAQRVFSAATKPTRILVTPGGRVVTVHDDQVVRVWSPTGVLERELIGHTAEIVDAHLSADGRSLATGSVDGTARVWDLESGKVVVAQCGDGLPVTAVRVSPDGNRVVSATDDNVMCYWNATNGAQIYLLRGHRGPIRSIRWSPDARKLVLTASADGTALLWKPFDGKPVLQPISHDGRAIASAEFSSDGRLIVTAGGDQLARLWAIPDDIPPDDPSLRAKELRRFAGHASALTAVVFDSKDERIATAGVDNKAKVWDVATGELLATFEHPDVVTTVAFSPGGHQLLTASTDHSAALWDLERGAAKRPFEVDAVVQAIAVSPAGDLAVGRADSRISVWRGGKGSPEILRDHTARVLAVAYSPDGKLLASGGEDAAVLLFDARTHAKVRSLGDHEGAIRSIGFSVDGRELATAGDDGIVRVWDLASGSIARTFRHTAPVIQLALSRDMLAVVDDQGLVWTAGRGSATLQMQAALTNDRTRAIAFSDDGNHVVAGGTDTRVYAVVDGVIKRKPLIIDGPTGEVRAVAFTRDATCVVTAGVEGLVQLWDADKGKLLGTRGTRGASINALATDGTTLWVGGSDQLVRTWDIHTETRDVSALGAIMEKVPWEIDGIDVVRRVDLGTSEGADGKRR